MSNLLGLEVVPVADVELMQIDWLFKPYIPTGKLTLLEGDPESGKTYLALAIAAAVTTGDVLNFGIVEEGVESVRDEPASVLYISAEDDIADTLKPRFRKLGGDENRLLAMKGGAAGFNLSQVSVLDETLRIHQPRLVVIDPLQGFLGAKVDMNRANEVRPILSGLSELAAKHRCSILLVRHLNKSIQQKAQYRGMGSIDFTATARSVLLAGRDPQDLEKFTATHTKSSLGRKGPLIVYSIDNDGLHWHGTKAPAPLTGLPTGDRAREFLLRKLADGPVASTEVTRMAASENISPAALSRGKSSLGVISKADGYQGVWTCRLPPKESPAGTSPLASDVLPTENTGETANTG